jgi:hypothetical protein
MPSRAVRRPPLWFFSFCAVLGSAFKLGRTADAIVWYEKTIALDPKRADADAERAYQQYLDVQPGSQLADGIQKKMALLP